jgi:hypothetical protein
VNAKDALDAMAATYASCASYVDDGEVLQPEGSTRRPFTTAFLRPAQLRFAYRDRFARTDWALSLIWWTGGDAHVYKAWDDSLHGKFSTTELMSAIASFGGVSGGSSHNIPRLLLPDVVRGWPLTELNDAVAVEDALESGDRCVHVTGFHPWTPTKVELWIDAATFLLHRLRKTSAEERIGVSTTNYRARINVDEPASLFAMTKESLIADA